MRTKSILLLLLFNIFVVADLFGQKIPLVYDVENTGANFPQPVLPSISKLPNIHPLTDPFEWSNGSGRDTSFAKWSHRRVEIKAEIEHYEIGPKPVCPENITASYSGGTITVNITANGNTLTLTSPVTLPSGEGPFPAVIGMGRGTGSLPSSIFISRGIATIAFNFGQVMSHTPWGVSRIIDGLELVSEDLNIDLKHLAVTGCSFAGKMALFAGAFDERIALTIAQESGGGGAAAWRVSETLGNVETLGRTSHAWFIEDMFKFANVVSKLPYDHHELMAMVAPRALLVLGNPDYKWLAEESGYVSCRAAHEVWKAFGVPEVEAYVEKFLLGEMAVNTDITKSPYDYVDYSRWFKWWGTGKPVFPERDSGDSESVLFEAECAKVGENWEILTDEQASNGRYVTVKYGIQSISAAPTGSNSAIRIPFTVSTAGNFFLFARLNCPSADDDSFWVKMDDGEFVNNNGLGTSGWEWVRICRYTLTTGEHTLNIAYREDGAKLDKICVSNNFYAPDGMGGDAENISNPTDN